MVGRDLRQIIEHVAPSGKQGTANVGQTRHVRACQSCKVDLVCSYTLVLAKDV